MILEGLKYGFGELCWSTKSMGGRNVFFCIFLKTPIKLVKLNFLYNFLIWMIANIYLKLS